MTVHENAATAADLRRRADERLKSQPESSPGPLSEVETHEMLHELRVRLIELEIQNEELHASRAKLRLLFEKIPAGIYFCDAEGLITSFNQRAAETWGRVPKTNDPADRFCGSFRLFAADGSPIAREQCWMAKALRDDKEYREHEIVVGRADGSRRTLLAHASPLHDDAGKITGGLNIVVDITERKRLEAALSENEGRLKMAIDAAHLGIFEHDHRTDITYWSPTLREIFGWNDDEPASLPAYLELVHPEERAAATTAVENAHDPAGTGIYRIEHRILLRDGVVRWIGVLSCTTFAGMATDRHAAVTTGTIADITELRSVEQTTRENESRLQLLVQAGNIGIWDWNLLTNEVYLSPVWKSQLGYADDEVPNRYEEWESRLHPDDRERMLTDLKARRENKNRYFEVEFRMRHKDGSWRWILNRDELVCAADGRAARMMGCHIDITARKQSEEELHTSRNRLAALARQLITVQESERRQLARELHDELGQALSAISINLKAAHRKVDADLQPLLQESIGIVDRAIHQVRDLALDLRPAMLDDFGLEPALRWYATRFAERTGVTAHITISLPECELPETVRNACFRLTQESLTNVLRHGKARQIWIDLQQQEDSLILTVRDDGQGFDVPQALERAARGKSLGLISMQERVELLGGRFGIESRPGAGTIMVARLPVPVIAESPEETEP